MLLNSPVSHPLSSPLANSWPFLHNISRFWAAPLTACSPITAVQSTHFHSPCCVSDFQLPWLKPHLFFIFNPQGFSTTARVIPSKTKSGQVTFPCKDFQELFISLRVKANNKWPPPLWVTLPWVHCSLTLPLPHKPHCSPSATSGVSIARTFHLQFLLPWRVLPPDALYLNAPFSVRSSVTSRHKVTSLHLLHTTLVLVLLSPNVLGGNIAF